MTTFRLSKLRCSQISTALKAAGWNVVTGQKRSFGNFVTFTLAVRVAIGDPRLKWAAPTKLSEDTSNAANSLMNFFATAHVALKKTPLALLPVGFASVPIGQDLVELVPGAGKDPLAFRDALVKLASAHPRSEFPPVFLAQRDTVAPNDRGAKSAKNAVHPRSPAAAPVLPQLALFADLEVAEDPKRALELRRAAAAKVSIGQVPPRLNASSADGQSGASTSSPGALDLRF